MRKHLNKIHIAALTCGLLILAGCVVTSVYPFYTAKDVVFDAALLGRWTPAEKRDATNAFWEFTRLGTNGYTLTIPDDGDKRATLQAYLFKLKGSTFLDAVPTEGHNDFVPPHYLLKVSQIEPVLKMAPLDYKWLEDILEKTPGTLRHVRVEQKPGETDSGRLVLTADTGELQKFILKHANNTNAFAETDGFVLERQR